MADLTIVPRASISSASNGLSNVVAVELAFRAPPLLDCLLLTGSGARLDQAGRPRGGAAHFRAAAQTCTTRKCSSSRRFRVSDLRVPPSPQAAAKSSPAGGGFDLIVASDVTYLTEAHLPLLNTISELLRRPTAGQRSSGLALVAHETRLTDLAGNDTQLASFVAAAERRGLCAEVDELHVPQEGSTGALISLSHRASGALRTEG